MNGFDIPDHVLAARRTGVGDFEEELRARVSPALVRQPIGPANFPVKLPDGDASTEATLNAILKEIKAQNTAAKPIIRGKVANPTETLDWDAMGVMDRLIIRNAGPSTVYFAFDKDGQAVEASVGNESWMLESKEAVCLTHSRFSKIGLRCAAGDSASVNAIGWQSVAGDQGSSIV